MDMDSIAPFICVIGVAWVFIKGLPSFFKFVDEEEERVSDRTRNRYKVKRRL